MKTRTKLLAQTTVLFLMTFTLATLRAQTTATWTGPAGDEWNTAADWDQTIVPGVGTNVAINGGSVVNYNVPMASPSIGTMALSGLLNVNASGFNIDGASTNSVANSLTGGGILNITAGGVVSIDDISNSPALSILATCAITNGGSLLFSNTGPITMAGIASPGDGLILGPGSVFSMTNTIGSAGINVGANSSSAGALVLVNGGSITLDKLLSIAGTASAVLINSGTVDLLGGSRIQDTSNDGAQRIQVNGGNVNLGNFSVFRSTSAGGLIVSNAVVNATGIQIGTGNSMAFATIGTGAFLTNTGTFTISDNTNAATSKDRRSQFLVRGGTVVSTGPSGIIIANQSNITNSVTIADANIGGILDINSGSVITPQITLIKDSTISNAYARLNLSGSGIIYLGSGGLVANVGVSKTAFNVALSGGTLAATAPWSSSAPMAITNVVTFQAADASSNPNNITLSGPLSGTGTLNKTANGILTLNGTNTYSGSTLVNAGTLAIGATGSIPNTEAFVVDSGATLDATALPAGLPINSAKTLQGLGTVLGTVNVAPGGIINPGSNTVTGTLTVGSLVENGGAILNYFTSTGPNPDFLVLTGDLDVTNVNNIQINGEVTGNTVYPLIQYGGNFNGSLANFSFTGATGSLSNNATTKTIYLVTAAPLRGPTNIVWVGNATNNVWDTTSSSNWLNNGNPDFFVPGDNARFDSTGAANPLVSIPGSVTPGSITVDTTSNYTFFGLGNIGGTGGLTKTNSGTLTILTTNSYTGPTVLNGGVLQVTNLALSSSPSSIGAAISDPSNLVINAGVLQYVGPTTSTDRGMTLTNTGGTIDVVAGTTLTLNGTVVGNGSLTVTDAGRLVLAGGNSYTNGTTVVGTTLQINNATGAGTGSITFSNSALVYSPSAGITIANPFNFTPATTNMIVVTSGSGANPLANGDWSGDGLIVISNTFSPYTVNGVLDEFTGTIQLITTNSFRFNSGGGNTSFGSTNATFDLGAGGVLINRNGGTMNLGALTGGANSSLQGQDAGTGTTIYSIGNNNLSTVFAGSIQDGATGRFTAITKVGTGTLTLQGSNTYTGATTINEGTLQVDGQITASSISVSAGELTGNGILDGQVNVGGGSTFVPGDGLGVLAISNSLTLNSGSTNIFELDAALGTNSSVAGLTGVSYGGNLIVTNEEGTFTSGETFTLFSSASYGGTWDSITLPSLDAGLHWDTSQLTVNGSITVRGQFQIASISRAPGNIILSGVNGSPSGTYYVWSTTNLTVPLADWTPLSTNTFNPDGTFSVTNAIDPTQPQLFYILQDVTP